MAADALDPDAPETRVIRRLCRLFRIERAGRFERRPPMTVRQLIDRRDALIDALMATETRRSNGEPPSPALLQAVAELAREVGRNREPAEARLRQLRAELRRRSGDPRRSGLRNGVGGRLLGSS